METLAAREQLLADETLICPPDAMAFLRAIENGDTDGVSCWRAPQVERREGSAIEGRGLFAIADVPVGSLVAIKQGHIVDRATIQAQADVIQGSHQQIGPHEFLAGLTPEEVEKNLVGYNHSCDPNTRVVLCKGTPLSFLVTRKPVSAGEEITADYAASQKSDTHLMELCRCGAPDCRHVIAPAWDWEDEALQAKYQGELAWFIQEAIDERNSLPQAEQKALLRHDATLKMAGTISLLGKAISDGVEARETRVAGLSPLLRPIARVLFARSPAGRELQEFDEQRVRAALYFCVVCPFANIQDAGVDRSILANSALSIDAKLAQLRPMVEKNLPAIVGFACDVDHYLGL